MDIIEPADLPKFLAPYRKLIKGVCVGGCRFGDDMEDGMAHAHVAKPQFGYICVLNRFYLRSRVLMLHEVGHLLAPDGRHGDSWRKAVLAIGGTLRRHCVCGNGHRSYYLKNYAKIPRESQVLKNAAAAREDLRLTIVETAAKIESWRI